MKKLFMIMLILCGLLSMSVGYARAQSSGTLELGLSRDFGYGGFGNEIQGLFSMKIKNPPENLTKVVFLIDGNSIGEDNQAPFAIQFNTDSYSLGIHSLSAIGYSTDGQEFISNIIQSEFVPASSATGAIAKFLGPVLGILVIAVVLSVAIPLIRNKGKGSSTPLGSTRKYGIGGGAICPKCGRPFPLRLWWINIGWNKIDRCPYCGKWSFVRPRSLVELRQAEATELSMGQPEKPITGESDSDKLNKNLDDSKFQDL